MGELRTLNRRFHGGSLGPKSLLSALRLLGIDPATSILISLYPDSGDTWCGELVDQDMSPIKFDIDLANPKHSAMENLGDDRFTNRQGQIVWSAIMILQDELYFGAQL